MSNNIQLYKLAIKNAEESNDDFTKSAIPEYKRNLALEISYIENKKSIPIKQKKYIPRIEEKKIYFASLLPKK